MKTKLDKVELEDGETVPELLTYYTNLGYSAGLIAEVFEVSGHTVRKWFKHFGLTWRKFPLQSLKCNESKGNPEILRRLNKEKATIIDGVHILQRERELGLSKGAIRKRLKRGWTLNAALNTRKDIRVIPRSRITKC